MVKEKIFGIGLSRTGTTSLTAAMNLLGYKSLHYPNYRLKNFTSIKIDKEELEKNEFLSDVPVAFLFKQLNKEYPDAKFILTIRDEESWLKSVSVFFTRESGSISKGHLIDFLKFINPKNSFFRGLYCLRYFVYGSFKFESNKYLKGYRKHNYDVIKYFEDKPEKN